VLCGFGPPKKPSETTTDIPTAKMTMFGTIFSPNKSHNLPILRTTYWYTLSFACCVSFSTIE